MNQYLGFVQSVDKTPQSGVRKLSIGGSGVGIGSKTGVAIS